MVTRYYLGYDGVNRRVYTARVNKMNIDYVLYDSCAVRVRHLDSMLAAAANTNGWGRLTLTQGGLSRAVAASAKTHYDLDVADISVRGKSKALVWEFCDNLFECGNLPFPRGYVRDSFQNNKHIHDLWYRGEAGHPELVAQENEWTKARGDGLVGPAGYTGPSNDGVGSWAESMYNPSNRVNGETTLYVSSTSELLGLDRDRRIKYRRRRGAKLSFVAKVRRWDRWNYLTSFGTFYAADYLTEKKPE